MIRGAMRSTAPPEPSAALPDGVMLPRPAALPDGVMLPRPETSRAVIAPPGDGPGNWAGAPSAARDGKYVYLAYRLRRPLGEGRGYAVAVARSEDGEHFQTVARLTKE